MGNFIEQRDHGSTDPEPIIDLLLRQASLPLLSQMYFQLKPYKQLDYQHPHLQRILLPPQSIFLSFIFQASSMLP
jgi:hypothetical protein